MKVSKRGTRFEKRSRRKTSFPLVAIVKKKNKPQYNPVNLTKQSIGKNEVFTRTTEFQLRSKEDQSFNTLDRKRDQLEHKNSVKRSRATIDYKNVVLLRKLITGQGKILPRHITQLTAKQERHAAKAIKSARILGLLPFINKSRPI
ncbi:30S ribosomal protein S18 [bacterium]|nr:MAG: 30S ribosomal protein S18 [bacterium]